MHLRHSEKVVKPKTCDEDERERFGNVQGIKKIKNLKGEEDELDEAYNTDNTDDPEEIDVGSLHIGRKIGKECEKSVEKQTSRKSYTAVGDLNNNDIQVFIPSVSERLRSREKPKCPQSLSKKIGNAFKEKINRREVRMTKERTDVSNTPRTLRPRQATSKRIENDTSKRKRRAKLYSNKILLGVKIERAPKTKEYLEIQKSFAAFQIETIDLTSDAEYEDSFSSRTKKKKKTL